MAAIAFSGLSSSASWARSSGEQASTSGSGCPPSVKPVPPCGLSHRSSSGAFAAPVRTSKVPPRKGGARGSAGRNLTLSAYGHRHQVTGSWAEDSFDEWGDLAFQFQLPEANSPRRVANTTNARTSTSTTSTGGSGQKTSASNKAFLPPNHRTVAWDRSSQQGPEAGGGDSLRGFDLDSENNNQTAEPTSRTPFPDPSSKAKQVRDAAGRHSQSRRDNSASQDGFGNDNEGGPAGGSPPLANGIEPWSLGPAFRAPSSLALVSCKGPAKGLYDGLKEVFVILFGVGEEGHEGIYSLRAIDRDDGLPHDTIIAFEDQADAERYAGQLDGTFRAFSHLPSVCSIPPEELLDFCVDAGYNCRLEPAGSHLLPPDFNVGTTDWERSLRLRNGNFAVLDHEPQFDANGGLLDETFKFGGLTELDRQKLQLERLLMEIGPDSSSLSE